MYCDCNELLAAVKGTEQYAPLDAWIDGSDRRRNAALWLAVRGNHVGVVRHLVAIGADVNVFCGDCVYWACRRDRRDILQALASGTKELDVNCFLQDFGDGVDLRKHPLTVASHNSRNQAAGFLLGCPNLRLELSNVAVENLSKKNMRAYNELKRG